MEKLVTPSVWKWRGEWFSELGDCRSKIHVKGVWWYTSRQHPLVNHFLIILITSLLDLMDKTVVEMLRTLGNWQTEEQKCLPAIWWNLKYSSPPVIALQFTIITLFQNSNPLLVFLLAKWQFSWKSDIFQQDCIKKTHSWFYKMYLDGNKEIFF